MNLLKTTVLGKRHGMWVQETSREILLFYTATRREQSWTETSLCAMTLLFILYFYKIKEWWSLCCALRVHFASRLTPTDLFLFFGDIFSFCYFCFLPIRKCRAWKIFVSFACLVFNCRTWVVNHSRDQRWWRHHQQDQTVCPWRKTRTQVYLILPSGTTGE